uniref:UBC core domain-containing protein n=1 Tax=Felis catus TaxID=9685 RepID=A0ABI7ZBS9_FELCA
MAWHSGTLCETFPLPCPLPYYVSIPVIHIVTFTFLPSLQQSSRGLGPSYSSVARGCSVKGCRENPLMSGYLGYLSRGRGESLLVPLFLCVMCFSAAVCLNHLPSPGLVWRTLSLLSTLSTELESLQAKLPRYLRNLFSHDADVLVWHALLLPEKPPYNLKAFHLRINFPEDYPFKPPTVTFTTRIYHPNVGHNGEVCLPIISKENWSPYTKTCQVLEALNVLVNRPDLGQPVRLELADLLKQDPELFHREAREFTLKYGVDRPS